MTCIHGDLNEHQIPENYLKSKQYTAFYIEICTIKALFASPGASIIYGIVWLQGIVM